MDDIHANEWLVRGRVRTNDPSRPVAEAVLVRGGAIAAVGGWDALRERAPRARVLDAGEGVVLPGLVDGHAHPLGLGRALVTVRLERAGSMEELVAACREWALANPEGWVVGRGWDQTRWDGPDVLPDRALLDAAFPDRPVCLSRVDGHALLANGAALRLAGVTSTTEPPAGGWIVRRPDGTPTGVLVDTAMPLVTSCLPRPSIVERRRALVAAMRHCLERGLTGVHDAGIGPDTDAAWRSLDDAGELGWRVYAMADTTHAHAGLLVERGPYRGSLYRMEAAKLFADGALGSRGAELFEPYCDDPGHAGLALASSERLRELAEPAARARLQVCVHAIGDKANARVLDLFEGMRRDGVPLERPRVEHAQLLRGVDLPRLARVGAVAAMQPVHATSDMRYAEQRLGAARLEGAYAWKTLREHGTVVAFGSDFPVEDADPLGGLHAATTRTDREGQPPGGWRPRECLTAPEALEAFTSANAFASFRERDLGRIRQGFRADMTILAADPFGPGGRWLDVPVLATVVDGVVRWER